MDNFLKSLPRSVLVGGALALGLFLIFLLNPPHTKCDSQFEIFQKAETPFLYKDPAKKFVEEPEWQTSLAICKTKALPGACFPFFEGLRYLIKDIKTISYDCRADILSKTEVSKGIWESLGAIFSLAWGDKPPMSYLDKMGWLDLVHKNIFCDLQALTKENFSQGEWEAFREKTLSSLPGAATIGRNEVWNRSLFTLKCP